MTRKPLKSEWTQTPNWLYDVIAKEYFTKNEIKLMLAINRSERGYQDQSMFSGTVNKLAVKSGVRWNEVQNTIESLKDKGLVDVISHKPISRKLTNQETTNQKLIKRKHTKILVQIRLVEKRLIISQEMTNPNNKEKVLKEKILKETNKEEKKKVDLLTLKVRDMFNGTPFAYLEHDYFKTCIEETKYSEKKIYDAVYLSLMLYEEDAFKYPHTSMFGTILGGRWLEKSWNMAKIAGIKYEIERIAKSKAQSEKNRMESEKQLRSEIDGYLEVINEYMPKLKSLLAGLTESERKKLDDSLKEGRKIVITDYFQKISDCQKAYSSNSLDLKALDSMNKKLKKWSGNIKDVIDRINYEKEE